MRELALHLLDIAENSIAAQAKTVEVFVEEDLVNDRLRLTVTDDGIGMDAGMIKQVTDPFTTTRTTRKVGLGIPLLKAAAEACRGELQISSEPGKGTRLHVDFQRSHIDRMPLGDLTGTILTLCVAHPQIHWVFRYRVNEAEYTFDDEPVKQTLGDIPLSEPEVLTYIRKDLEQGVAEIQ